MTESPVNSIDKQKVPKAITFIQPICKLQTLDTASYTPSQAGEHKALATIGTVFSAFIVPFVDTRMSLAEQLAVRI